MKERVWIFEELLQVSLGAYRRVRRVSNKFGEQKRHWLCTTHAVVVQQAIEQCAQADDAGFQPGDLLFVSLFDLV